MPTIDISVRDKMAREPTGCAYIVCNNTDYVARFNFDAEWDAYSVKTARFIWNGQYRDIVFSGSECAIPAVDDASAVGVGVFAGELRTTTPAMIMCLRSVLDGDGIPAPPSEDVYAQIMELLNETMESVSADAERAEAAADRSETASVHAPYIGENGNWFVWDAETQTMVDTGVPASGGTTYWNLILGKPFSSVGENLKVVNGALSVDTAPNVQQDNTKPITSAAVYTEVGNIEALLALI